MTPKRLFLILIWSLITTLATVAQQDPSLLSVERIFTNRDFRAETFGPARWLDGGSSYTTLEKSADDSAGMDIVKYDTKSGKRSILVSAKQMTPDGATKPLKIDAYEWSTDKQLLLLFANTQRVWRYNTRGDYWVLNLKTGSLKQLGGDAKPGTLMFAKFSPDGSRVGYVRENNVYVENLQSGAITALTSDGSETIVNGTSDWVYEEEFGLRDGFRWSPDGQKIAYWHFDKSGVGTFYMINNTDSLYSRPIPLEYPKVGTTNSDCKVGVVSASGGETTWFAVPGDPRNNYIPWMEWADNSSEVLIQQLNRLQNTNTVWLGSVADGSVKTVLIDKDDAWVEVNEDVKWLDGGKAFTWLSDRDGWLHMYKISRDGEKITLLTPGDYDVVKVETIDAKGGWVYFTASPDNPTQRYLFRVPLNGEGTPEALTPQDQPGTHAYQISPDAKWAFQTYSTYETPPVVSLVNLPNHRRQRAMLDNKTLREKVDALKKSPVEFFRVSIGDGVELDAWEMKPPDFDPAKKYPLFFFVYGEPAGQTVLDRWFGNRYLWHLMLAQQGYVVMSVDNRGTPGPRGRDWRKSIYRQIGILASQDQAAAAKKILKTHSYLDADRVGIWGWSGGGSMTLNMMFRYPEIYHTGMGIAFVSNQRLYDTIYQERYMGLPDDNVEGFTNGSPITYAQNLKGNLLIIHGTADDNVHYQSFEKLVNKLIEHNKHFTMMAYPNRSHAIREGKGTSRHLYELMTRYLNENLPAGPKQE